MVGAALEPTPRRAILVYRTGQLGDTIVSLPSVHAIKAAFPDRDLVLLTDRHPGRGLVSSWDVFERTGLFSRVLFYTPASTPAGWLRFIDVACEIRRIAPEKVFCFRDLRRTRNRRDEWFFRSVCGISEVFGGEAPDLQIGDRDGDGRLQRFPFEGDRLLGVAAAAGVPSPPPGAVVPSLPVGADEYRQVDLLWREVGLPPDAILVAFGIGSKMPAKQWPLERFVELANRLLATHPNLWLLAVGGLEDEALTWRLKCGVGSRLVSIAGRLSVFESAEALRRCAMYVGNDTGAMHLAASVGTRCVALFSARDHPGRWDPYGRDHIILRTNPPCAGCLLQECTARGMVCLTDITVDAVYAAVEKTMASIEHSTVAPA